MLPGRIQEYILAIKQDLAGIARGLSKDGRNVYGLPLRLNHADAGKADEEGIIHGAACCGPLGNGSVASVLRPRPLRMTKVLAVSFPAHPVQLRVDEAAGISLVKFELGSGITTGLNERDGFLLGRSRCGSLQLCQFLSQAGLRSLLLVGQLLPHPPVFALPLCHLLRSGARLRLLFSGRMSGSGLSFGFQNALAKGFQLVG